MVPDMSTFTAAGSPASVAMRWHSPFQEDGIPHAEMLHPAHATGAA
jgi:hypothetical protein